MEVKNHDHKSASHLPLDEVHEPPLQSTTIENYLKSICNHANCDYMGYRAGLSTAAKQLEDEYSKIKYDESQVYVHTIVQALNTIEKGDRCVIYAKNSPLWLLTDLAITFAGGIVAPVYDTLGIDNIIFCINLVQAKAIFVSGEYLPNIIGAIHKMPTVQIVYSYDEYDTEKTKQQAHKVYLAQSDTGFVIRDDTGSMYSINPNSDNGKQQELPQQTPQTDTQQYDEIDKLLTDKKNNQVEIKLLTQFPTITADQIKESHAFLEKQVENLKLKPEDLNSIIFTSGTSGKPKGVIATNINVISGGACLGRQFVPYHNSDKGGQNSMVSYLPLAHVFERNMEHLATYRGYCIYYSSGNIRNLTKDLQLAKSTMMIGVPRVFCKIHQAVFDKLKKQSPIVRAVFSTAYNLKKMYLKYYPNAYRYGKMPIVDLVFKQIQAGLGGQMEFVVSGSSALPENVREFLQICTGARLTVGYGLTEASCAGLYNHCGQHFNHPNQLGHVCWGFKGIVVDRSSDCEFQLEKDKIGELMLSGVGIAQGYVDGQWGKVKKMVDDKGYYATGDLVKLYDDGTVSFIRRVGLVCKLQQGEFVDLEAIENALEKSPLILVAITHAEADKSAPVCIVSVDSSVLKEKIGVDKIEAFLKNDPNAISEVEKFIYSHGDQVVREQGLKGFNVPKGYKVFLDKDWTANTDLYTPSQKKKHNSIVNYYKEDLNQLWKLVREREQEGKTRSSKPHSINKNYLLMFAILVIFFVAFKFAKM